MTIISKLWHSNFEQILNPSGTRDSEYNVSENFLIF